MYFVYILKSIKDQKHYIGYTTDLKRRLEDHNRGKSQSVRNRGPFEIIYQETCSTKQKAIVRERQIKSYKGGEAFKKLLVSSTPSSSLVRTRAFQALGRGSNPLGVINFTGSPARSFYSGRDPALELIPWRENPVGDIFNY